MTPKLNEGFADNGAHSHWELIDAENGKILWSEDPDESPAQEDGYWKLRCEAAENLLAVMDVPKNKPDTDNHHFVLFGERNEVWQKSKYPSPSTDAVEKDLVAESSNSDLDSVATLRSRAGNSIEHKKATNIPDGDGNEWMVGAETFTRQEVFKLLYTQRAMISNDLKSICGDDLTKPMYDILENPRTPKI